MVREWKGTDVLRAGLGSSFNVLDRLQGDSRISVGAVQKWFFYTAGHVQGMASGQCALEYSAAAGAGMVPVL